MIGVGISAVLKSISRFTGPVIYSLFIPSGSDSLITSDGDTFKVRD